MCCHRGNGGDGSVKETVRGEVSIEVVPYSRFVDVYRYSDQENGSCPQEFVSAAAGR